MNIQRILRILQDEGEWWECVLDYQAKAAILHLARVR